MLNELFTNHGLLVFSGLLFLVVLLSLISTSRKYRKERPDPPMIFAPIRGMYICYQCDNIFNTPRCPACDEEAVIPLVHLTGSIMEEDRITAVIDKLQDRRTWRLPKVKTFIDGQAFASVASPEPGSLNGDGSEVPVKSPMIREERPRELS